MKQKVVIIGNAVGAEIIYSIISRDSSIEIAAFSVHQAYMNKDDLFGIKVIPFENLSRLFPPDKYKLINAVGYTDVNRNREKIFLEAKSFGYSFFTYMSPGVSNFSEKIGEGVFIMPGAVLEPFSSVGDNSYIWSNTVVAHHATIEENCWIASGVVISGGATVRHNCFLGVHSTIANKVVVGEYNIIGAHALIMKNTAANGVYLARSGECHRFSSEDYAKHILL